MVSSFHPHSIYKKVERVTAKTGCTSCTNQTISFEVSGFRTKTHLLHRQFKILITYYNSRIFIALRCTSQFNVINFHPFLHNLLFSMHLLICFRSQINHRESEKQYKMNSEKVETWQGIIISPAQHVQKSREGYGKNWMHFVYKLDNLLRSIRVSDENSSVTPAIQYCNNLLQLQNCSAFRCAIQIHVINFQPFVTYLLFLKHLLICSELNGPKIEKHYKLTLKMLKLGMVSSYHPHSMRERVERVTE